MKKVRLWFTQGGDTREKYIEVPDDTAPETLQDMAFDFEAEQQTPTCGYEIVEAGNE